MRNNKTTFGYQILKSESEQIYGLDKRFLWQTEHKKLYYYSFGATNSAAKARTSIFLRLTFYKYRLRSLQYNKISNGFNNHARGRASYAPAHSGGVFNITRVCTNNVATHKAGEETGKMKRYNKSF